MSLKVVYKKTLSLSVLLVILVSHQNCGHYDSSQQFGNTESSTGGGDLTRGLPWQSPGAEDIDTVIVGDMILDRSQIGMKAQKKYFPDFYERSLKEKEALEVAQLGVAKHDNGQSFWPNGIVPIKFESSVPDDLRDMFMEMCENISSFSNVRCTTDPAVLNSRNSHVIVRVDPNLQCAYGFATIGYRGEVKYQGKHYLRFGVGTGYCNKNSLRFILTHEFIHILGFYHAHVHVDRDQYVRYYPENVQPGLHNNFAIIYDEMSPYDTEYDRESIMHYAGNLFAINNADGKVFSALRPNTQECTSLPSSTPYWELPNSCKIRTYFTMSEKDKESIKLAYGVPGQAEPESCSLDGVIVEHGDSHRFFESVEDDNCSAVSIERTCTDGALSGSDDYRYANCSAPPVVVEPEVIRAEIQNYINHAKTGLYKAKYSQTNNAKVYFKSDETNSYYSAYYYGPGSGVADKELSWALSRYYYAYCEARDPSGNIGTYFNRCIDRLRVYSTIQSNRSVSMEFHLDDEVRTALASDPDQAASTLISYLIDEFGDVSFNTPERANLLSPTPAVLVLNDSDTDDEDDDSSNNNPPENTAKKSCSFSGVVLGHGESKVFYSSTTSSNCNAVKQLRYCNDGALSGSNLYQHASCQQVYSSCSLDGKTLNHGESSFFYSNSVSTSCTSQRISRTCNDGVLSGSAVYNKASCSAPSNCVLDGVSVSHGTSRDFYSFSSHENCASRKQSRTCVNGTFSGSSTYKYKSCQTTVVVPDPVRKDISDYNSMARSSLSKAQNLAKNRVKLYLKSDDADRVYQTYYYGSGAADGDKWLSWGLSYGYYAYCEAKNPNGNLSHYSNRCVNGLKIYSRWTSDNKIELEFKNSSGVKSAVANSTNQAVTTLYTFLNANYGSAPFNSAETALLMIGAAAQIKNGTVELNDTTTQQPYTPKNCLLDGKTVLHNSAAVFYLTEESDNCSLQKLMRKCNDGILTGSSSYRYSSCVTKTTPVQESPSSDIVRYNNDAKSGFQRVKSGAINNVQVYFKSDEPSQNYNAYYYGYNAELADKWMSWSLSYVYYAYCEAKNPAGNNIKYFNRCISNLRVYTKINSQRKVEMEFRGQTGTRYALANNPEQAASTLIKYLESTYGDPGFNSAEKSLLSSISPAAINSYKTW